jgi:hypothetical protein
LPLPTYIFQVFSIARPKYSVKKYTNKISHENIEEHLLMHFNLLFLHFEFVSRNKISEIFEALDTIRFMIVMNQGAGVLVLFVIITIIIKETSLIFLFHVRKLCLVLLHEGWNHKFSVLYRRRLKCRSESLVVKVFKESSGLAHIIG